MRQDKKGARPFVLSQWNFLHFSIVYLYDVTDKLQRTSKTCYKAVI